MKTVESIAMENSYNLIMGKDMIGSGYLIHNPNEPLSVETLKRLFDYYKSQKAWNRCVKIQTLLVKTKYYNEIKRLSKKNS